MTITIGIDPHKASHTAVAIDDSECVLDEHRLRACSDQAAWYFRRTAVGPPVDRVARHATTESVGQASADRGYRVHHLV